MDISRLKKNLIKKAKKKGLYENFGQKEVLDLEAKYRYYDWNSHGANSDKRVYNLISKFNNWCMNFNDKDLRGS